MTSVDNRLRLKLTPEQQAALLRVVVDASEVRALREMLGFCR